MPQLLPSPPIRAAAKALSALLALLIAAHGASQAQDDTQSGPSATAKDPADARAMAIGKGLHWLRKHHGSTEHPFTVGSAGMAVLAMSAQGSTLRQGPFRDQIKTYIRYLRAQQQEDGTFGATFSEQHCIAAMAMIEAQILADYVIIRKHAALGADRIQKRFAELEQQPPLLLAALGGQTLFAATFVKDWRPQTPIDAALEHVEAQRVRTGRYEDVSTPWAGRRDRQHLREFPLEFGELKTAAGLASLLYLDEDHRLERKDVIPSAEILRRRGPTWNPDTGAIDEFYWLLGTVALRQIGGDAWADWQSKLDKALIPNQVADGDNLGSWDPVGAWGKEEGRAWTTAMMVTILLTENRHSPFVKLK